MSTKDNQSHNKITCSECGVITRDDIEVIDMAISCTKCGGIDWFDDGFSITFNTEDDGSEVVE